MGLLLALAGAVVPTRSTATALPSDVVARVNGANVSADVLAYALARLDGATAEPERRAKALTFLIDEDLLVQRAVEMGLVASDRTVRKAIVMAMIDATVADVLAQDPSPEDIRAYYESHRPVFSQAPRLHVRHMRFALGGAPALAFTQAAEARAAVLQGDAFAEVRARYGASGGEVPDGLVPIHTLRSYLGPALTDLLADVPADTTPDVIETSTGYHVVQVVRAQPGHTPAFEDIRGVVEREYVRRARDTALDNLLAALRTEADIALASDAPS